MKKIVVLLVGLALILVACSGQSTQVQEKPTAAQKEVVEIVPTATQADDQALPTEESVPVPTDTPESDAGEATLTVFRIVPGESKAQYEVGETFFNQNNRFNLAIGITMEISGTVQVDTENPQNSSISPLTIDISQLASDSARRDNAIRDRFLESSKFPIATFVPTSIDGLPSTYTEGEEITFKVTGDLTVHDVTKPVTFEVTAKVSDGTLSGTATTTVLLSDFGIGPITIAGILGTEDEAKLTLAFVARPE